MMDTERDDPAAVAAQPNPGPAVGEALADGRRALGLSVEDIARQLKFSVRQIEALEHGRFEQLSGPPFVRGMVRAYARLVRVDADPLVRRLAPRTAEPDQGNLAASLRKPIPFSDGAKRVNLVYAALSLAVLGVIGAVAWEWHGERSASNRLTFVRAAQVPLEPARAPVAVTGTELATVEPQPAAGLNESAAETEASPAADGRRRLTLHFDRESWVQIRARDGRILLSQLNPAGTERVVEGRPPFDVVIGNAQHVRLRYDDRPIDLAPHVKVEVARFTLE